MTELPGRYDVTITVDRDGGRPPSPAEFAVAAGRRHRPELPSAFGRAGPVTSDLLVTKRQ